MNRRLTLKRESLAALSTDELAAFGAAAPALTPDCPFETFPVLQCLSLDRRCIKTDAG